MTGEKPFRFGVNLLVPDSRAAWIEKCRKVEDLGYDVLATADHLGMAPPFPALVLAADVTERVQLNTFVLNAAFYNPALLAREVTGTDQFTDGRLELGLGAGYARAEFEAAGMPFPSARERVDHLEHTIHELARRYADPEHKPAPVRPGGPPLLVAGRGDRILALAAEHADIVGFTGTAAAPAGGGLPLATAEGVEERVRFVRDRLGERDPELNLLCYVVDVTDDRAGALEKAAKLTQNALSVEQLAEVPTVLAGSPAAIVEQLHAHRERFGLTYFTVTEYHLTAFAPVLEALR